MYLPTQAPLVLGLYLVFIHLAYTSPLPQSSVTDALRNAANAVSAKYDAANNAINAAQNAANAINAAPSTATKSRPDIPNMTTQDAKKWCESNASACDKACTGALGAIAGVSVGPGGPLIAAVWCNNVKPNVNCSVGQKNCNDANNVVQASDNTLKNAGLPQQNGGKIIP